MPRVTRAGQRTNAILDEEANIAAATPLPSTPTTTITAVRAPLGEIAANTNGDAVLAGNIGIELKPTKKGTVKGKKTKGTKKGTKKNKDTGNEIVEVLEDDSQSTTSSAVEEACEDLMRSHSGEIRQAPMHDAQPQTPRSKAVYLAVKKLSPKKPQTPRFDPNVHKMPEGNQTPSRKEEDSFVGNISSRTPAKIVIHEDKEENADNKSAMATPDVAKEDSFAEYIIARSPLKSRGRIEDSVEEIDALEEAIERFGESLPVIVDEPQSPVKNSFGVELAGKDMAEAKLMKNEPSQKELEFKKEAMAPTLMGPETEPKKVAAAKKPTIEAQKKDPVRRSPVKTPATSTRKITPTRSVSAKATPATAKASLPPSTQPISKKPSGTGSPKHLTATTRPIQRRVSSITKAPFVPQRSTKPPTRSTFTLPGESISQKLKAQREERLKQQEVEGSKKRVFKARPVPASLKKAPVVKPTATSKTRISIAKGEIPAVVAMAPPKPESGKRPIQTVKKGAPRFPIVSSTAANVDGPAHPIKKRSSVIPEPRKVKANTSTPRAPAPTAPVVQTAVTPTRLAVQKTRGKEVFGRERVDLAAKDQEKRQKEEAAKKARAEAAEKGRQASREWAEKMKAKKAAAAAASTGDTVAAAAVALSV